MGIDKIVGALRIFGVKKNELIGDPLKHMYIEVACYVSHERHSRFAKYDHDDKEEGEDEKDVRLPSPKRRVNTFNKRSSLQVGKSYFLKPLTRQPNNLCLLID